MESEVAPSPLSVLLFLGGVAGLVPALAHYGSLELAGVVGLFLLAGILATWLRAALQESGPTVLGYRVMAILGKQAAIVLGLMGFWEACVRLGPTVIQMIGIE